MVSGLRVAMHPTVARILEMLDEDPTLVGRTLSVRLGISVSRLARLFRRHMSMSIVEYRNRLRFQRFFALIKGSPLQRPSLREAALAAGFGSYAHFHRLFWAEWHIGPSEFLRGKRGRVRSRRAQPRGGSASAATSAQAASKSRPPRGVTAPKPPVPVSARA
jgi:transcriptional regulator GlxA family with amidase domain